MGHYDCRRCGQLDCVCPPIEPKTADYCARCDDSPQSAAHVFDHEYAPPFDPGDRADPTTVEEELAALRALADEFDTLNGVVDTLHEQTAELNAGLVEYERTIEAKDRQIEALYEELELVRADRDEVNKRLVETDAALIEVLEEKHAAFDDGWAEGVFAGNEAGEITGFARGWDAAVNGLN